MRLLDNQSALQERHRARLWVCLAVCVSIVGVLGTAASASGPSSSWWMVDTHEHSAFSGDAKADIGVDAQVAQSLGYSAVFLTDHDRGTGFQINGANGNYQAFVDPKTLPDSTWTAKPTTAAGGAAVPVLATSPARGGTGVSAHLSVSASKAVGSMIYSDRGPTLNSGDVTLSFWLYPQTLTGSAGADVSVSLGGDATSGASAFGYTTADGITHAVPARKSTVLVWQVGSTRIGAQNGTTDVYVSQLHAPTMLTWNHYTVNVMTGALTWSAGSSPVPGTSTWRLNNLPHSDAPLASEVVLSYEKLEAATTGTGGTADVYFDDYVAESAGARCPAQEFVDRNALINAGTFNTATFQMYPAREMGQNYHSNQFVFDPKIAADYFDNRNDAASPSLKIPEPYGDDAALCASSNTPSARWSFAYNGVDNITKVQNDGYPAQMNHPGITENVDTAVSNHDYGADLVEVHTGDDFSSPWDRVLSGGGQIIGTYGSDAHRAVSKGAPADFIFAPSFGRNDLLHSLFEGRSFMASNTFTGHIGFNLASSSGTTPYPARYPIYLPASQSSTQAHLGIDGGLKAGETVKWFASSNGALVQAPDPNPTGKTVLFAPPLGTPDTISGTTTAYDQTRAVPLASGFTYVRAAVYDSTGSLYANTQPIFYRSVNGMPAGMSAHVDSIAAPTGTCSCTIAMTKGITSIGYSGTTLSLGLTNPQDSDVELRVQSPQAPVTVTVDGTSVPQASSLAAYGPGTGTATSWFYDNSAKLLYLRDLQKTGSSSIAINSSTGGGGGGGGGGTQIFTATADTYVDSGSPTASYGKNVKLRLDNSPSTVDSYLRFNLNGISGTVTAVTLKLYATSSLNAGFLVNTVANDTWGETMTWNTAPPIGGQIGTAQNVLLNTYVTVTLPPSTVTGNGDVNLALAPNSATALSLASRDDPEPTHAPQLIVTTS